MRKDKSVMSCNSNGICIIDNIIIIFMSSFSPKDISLFVTAAPSSSCKNELL